MQFHTARVSRAWAAQKWCLCRAGAVRAHCPFILAAFVARSWTAACTAIQTSIVISVIFSSILLRTLCAMCFDVEVCIPAAAVGNSGAIWTGTGGLTISRSRRPFSTAYVRFIQALVQPALTVMHVLHAWTSASFYLHGLCAACA